MDTFVAHTHQGSLLIIDLNNASGFFPGGLCRAVNGHCRVTAGSAGVAACRLRALSPAPYELILMYRQRCVSKQLQEALALLFVEPLRLKHDVEFLKRALIREGHLFGVVINDGGPRVFADVERFVE